MLFSSKENFDTAREVLAAVPQPQPTLETVIITLLQIAIYSEEVELEIYVVPFHLFRALLYVRQRTTSPIKRKIKDSNFCFFHYQLVMVSFLLSVVLHNLS